MFQQQFLKNCLSDLAQIWELSLVCYSLCNRPILSSNTTTSICLYNYLNCVGAEGLFVHPIHVSTRFFNVTYLNTENCIIYTAFLQHPDLKKKKDPPTDSLDFQAKGANKALFFLGLSFSGD